MKKIALITNFNIPDKVNAAIAVVQKLQQHGCEVITPAYNREKIARHRFARGKLELTYVSQDAMYSEAELLIILGGDGTVLTSMHRYGLLDVPFFGVNFGHLGYLTECDPQDTEAYIDAVLEDRCTLEERIVLEGTLCSGEEKTNFVGINEAVIHRAALNRALRFSISVNGNIIHNFAGDGILVATPTGSTAYNISAGGPVLMPASDCFVITPICSQYRSSCPLVVSAKDVIEISIRELPHFIPGSDSPPVMDVDSFARLTVQPGSSVTFRKAEQKVRMLKLSSESFYIALKKKLSSNGG